MAPLGDLAQGHATLFWCWKTNKDVRDACFNSSSLVYRKGDYAKLSKAIMDTDWSAVLVGSIDDMYSKFLSIYNAKCKEFIPSIKPGNRRSRQPWMTNGLFSLIKVKRDLWYRNQTSDWSTPQLVAQYKSIAKLTRKTARQCVVNYEHNIASDKHNPKRLYAYIRSRKPQPDRIGALTDSNGCILEDRADIATLLNRTFHNVFVKEPSTELPSFANRTVYALQNLNINTELLAKFLSKLDPNKSIGPDGVHPRVLRNCSSAFIKPITILFDASLAAGSIPLSWKQANVTPLYKKGDKLDPSNYRPISLTSILCRLLEKLIKQAIMHHLLTNNLISKHQHGFIESRSCTTNLLETLDVLTDAKNKKSSVHMIYLDFQKAFDTVPHAPLLVKLKGYGIQGGLLNWIEAFLSGRSQRVVMGQAHSDWLPVTSGVPQGSVLGPTLFIIFINDLVDQLKSIAKLYADDTKLISIINSIADCQRLQEDLDLISNWTKTWLMQLNTAKCHVMKITAHQHLDTAYQYHLTDSNGVRTPLTESSHERDLGITVSSDLKFSKHVQQISGKTRSLTGLIANTFSCRDLALWKLLYTSFIRPHIEFAAPVWSPHLKKDIQLIENVQRMVTRIPTAARHLSYRSRCQLFGIQPLEERRKRGDMIQFYKMARNIETINWHSEIQRPTHQYSTRRTSLYIRERVPHCLIRHNFFINRATAQWYALPERIKAATSVNSFKSLYDQTFS